MIIKLNFILKMKNGGDKYRILENHSFLDWSLLVGNLDDTDGNGLLHVSNGESSQWWVFSERFNTHWLGWGEDDQSRVSVLD